MSRYGREGCRRFFVPPADVKPSAAAHKGQIAPFLYHNGRRKGRSVEYKMMRVVERFPSRFTCVRDVTDLPPEELARYLAYEEIREAEEAEEAWMPHYIQPSM